MEEEILESIGLSKRESIAYLALIELGASTIGPIVKKTDIPSSKIYEVLERLIEKGLVSYIIEKSQKHFQASDPEIILNRLEEKQEKLRKIIPQLKEKQRFSRDKQEVELYEGKQAIFSILRLLVEQAKDGDEYLSFSLGKEHGDKEVSTFLDNLAQRRIEKKLKIRVLSNIKAKETIEKAYSPEILKKISNKYTNIEYPQGMIVLNNNLIMLDWIERPTAIRITSGNIVKKYREFFYNIYNKN